MTPNMKFRTWTYRAWNNDLVPPLAKEPDMCPVHLYCNWSHIYSYITLRNVSRNHCYRLKKMVSPRGIYSDPDSEISCAERALQPCEQIW